MTKNKVKLKEFVVFWGLLFNVIPSTVGNESLDSKLTLVWGPGLEPHEVVMPARYFFIQAVDKNNNRYINRLDLITLSRKHPELFNVSQISSFTEDVT